MAMLIMAMEMRSPVETSMSISLGSGCSANVRAWATRESVVLPMAETTVTI